MLQQRCPCQCASAHLPVGLHGPASHWPLGFGGSLLALTPKANLQRTQKGVFLKAKREWKQRPRSEDHLLGLCSLCVSRAWQDLLLRLSWLEGEFDEEEDPQQHLLWQGRRGRESDRVRSMCWGLCFLSADRTWHVSVNCCCNNPCRKKNSKSKRKMSRGQS